MFDEKVLEFNSERLITEPRIYLVGQTAFNIDAMEEWAVDNDLGEVSMKSGTPLCSLLDKAEASKYGLFESELMAEFGGRFCYRSWKAGRPTEEYIKNVIESAHNSVLRHMVFNFVIEGVSRSFSHELVRHAAGTAPSQESQRYVDAKDIKFVIPPLELLMWDNDETSSVEENKKDYWNRICVPALREYMLKQEEYRKFISDTIKVDEKSLIKKRANEAARAVLSNCAETRLLFSMNGDAMRHILHLRGDKHADLEIRRFAVALFGQMKDVAPNTLFDFKESKDAFGPTLER